MRNDSEGERGRGGWVEESVKEDVGRIAPIEKQSAILKG